MTVQNILRNVARSLGRARPRTGSRGKRNNRDRFGRFTERARRVIHFAQKEAQHFQHNYIGTEHLLLGLLRESEGVAAKVLKSFDVDIEKVRQAVEQVIGRGDRPVSGEVGLTPRAKKVIELAVDEARSLNHHFVGTEHLLLGLLHEGHGIGAGALESFGLDLQAVRAKVMEILNSRRQLSSCSFCDKRQDQVQRLIGGPGNVFVCDECVVAFSKALDEAQQEEKVLSCSLCGKKQAQVSHLTTGPHGVNICSECVVLCQEITDEEQSRGD